MFCFAPGYMSVTCHSITGNPPIRIRKDVNKEYEKVKAELNQALEYMKSKSSDDWSSFENIANYHGAPYMCDGPWLKVYPPGQGSWGCCNHRWRQIKLFAAWHRTYNVNFEL